MRPPHWITFVLVWLTLIVGSWALVWIAGTHIIASL